MTKKPTVLPEVFLCRVAETIRLLGHSQRLRIIEYLDHHGESSVGAIVAGTEGRQAAVSQHLNKMRLTKIIGARRDGRQVYYRIIAESAVTILNCIRKQHAAGLAGG